MLHAGVGFRRAVGVAFAGDTVSITTMEIVAIAFVLTVPADRRLITRGRGHAAMHELHAHQRPGSNRSCARSHQDRTPNIRRSDGTVIAVSKGFGHSQPDGTRRRYGSGCDA